MSPLPKLIALATFLTLEGAESSVRQHVLNSAMPKGRKSNIRGERKLSEPSILDVVVASENHMILEAAVLAAPNEIGALLGDVDATLTVFAPDDEAFGNLPEGVVGRLTSSPWQPYLGCVLKGHVYLEGAVDAVTAISLAPTSIASAEPGYSLEIEDIDGSVAVNNVLVETPDIDVSNGIIHSITGVLLPPCVTDNIVSVLSADPDFTQLVELATAANLVGALMGDPTAEGLTLLAPTNDAFNAVDDSVMEYLGSNVTALVEVLTYHVIGSNYYGAAGNFATLQGQTIDVTVDDSNVVSIGDATVQGTVLASNGVVHKINAVLVPNIPLTSADPAIGSPEGGNGKPERVDTPSEDTPADGPDTPSEDITGGPDTPSEDTADGPDTPSEDEPDTPSEDTADDIFDTPSEDTTGNLFTPSEGTAELNSMMSNLEAASSASFHFSTMVGSVLAVLMAIAGTM